MVAFDKNGQGYFTFEEVSEHAAVIGMTKVFHPQYREEAVQAFYRVFNRHMACLGTEKRKEFDLNAIKSIHWKNKENCWHVHYKNGEWLHYLPKGEWF